MWHIILTCIVLTAYQAGARHRALTLQKAVDLGLVKARAASLGGHQGLCMQVSLKNLSADSLVILIEAGRRLNSLDDNNQDILIVREAIVALKKGQEKSLGVKGYCCQSGHRSPLSNALYGINKMADSNLVKVARYLNAGAFDNDAEQHAVWAISDNQPAATVTADRDSLALPLRSFIAGLKGEQLPWYTVASQTYVYANGAISVFPVLLKGKMQYSTDKDSYITLTVLNEKGQPVCLQQSHWLKAAAQAFYSLALPVKGLAKGRYTVELNMPGKQLARQEFEL